MTCYVPLLPSGYFWSGCIVRFLCYNLSEDVLSQAIGRWFAKIEIELLVKCGFEQNRHYKYGLKTSWLSNYF